MWDEVREVLFTASVSVCQMGESEGEWSSNE